MLMKKLAYDETLKSTLYSTAIKLDYFLRERTNKMEELSMV